ncbi:hypothetical protein OPQ81_010240 [Rhizoctonia solani]|nr:hypothetical protein OPQ81_010240 [Rhizoctonia solani]
MRLFYKLFRSGFQHASKRFREDISVSKEQNSPVLVDFILVDAEEEEENFMEACTDTPSSNDCLLLYAENQPSNIPLALRSDTPLSATCSSSNFLSLRATHPYLPLPMGVSNGTEICINASFKGYLATLLVPCLWLVLGSYVFVATTVYIFQKKHEIETKASVEDVDIQTTQEIPACDTLISGTALPTPDEVLEYTLKQYGHLFDSEQDDTGTQCSKYHPPPHLQPKPITLHQKALKLTVRKDVDIMLRRTVPNSRIPQEHDSREIHSAPWATSVHTTAINVVEASMPVVRIPTQTLAIKSIPVQHNTVVPYSIEVGAGLVPSVLLRRTAIHRPTPITTNNHHLRPMQHHCFNSSPLRYSYTNSPAYSPDFVTPGSGILAIPASTLKRGMWSPRSESMRVDK